MPEMKRNFTKGKMNKDLDERLIPNGEYRDAMNIQVSTADDSDVGTMQNLLGNIKIDGQSIILPDFTCVGSVSDEKHDKLYWFITNENDSYPDTITTDATGYAYKDCIIEYDKTSDTVTPVFVDIWVVEFPWIGTNLASSGPQLSFTLSSTVNLKVGMKVKFITINPDWSFEREITSIGAGGVITVDEDFENNTSGVSSQNIIGLRIVNPNTVEIIPRIILTTPNEGGPPTEILIPSRENTIIERTLNFRNNPLGSSLIIGINIIDDMLFWTDNKSEPKKINIQRSIRGTNPNGNPIHPQCPAVDPG